ncbi:MULTISPECIES: ESX secretion-associated protein EspG [unclassified Amycolatopsis]|uniref:ESX secretion-associated protein EspG n=1 Tax=unclassified Amycolatopsis TaxID=2618356 RepID=UPI001FF389D1|nr:MULTISPECIES: ESX secretion-associated protein EspG [unclassified Amycolatopsis]UOZ04782.1 ESX secretion-associated protein EspG [Amycolatopsis sp. WQ 127309]WSK76256.1 ESX secretion-associated protein EspG [Amycolatopsis sp. NBC_01286]
MADRFEFVLEVVEALVVGQATGGDVRRYPLRAGYLPADPVRFVHVARQVYDALEERRLSVSGELHPGVRTAFELLASPRVSVAVSGIDGLGADVAVLVVTDGAQALGITQAPDTDELLFSLFADEDLVEVVTGVLPPAPAATTGRHVVHRAAGREVSAMTAKRRADAEFDEEETDAFGMIEVKAVVRPGRRPPARPTSDVAVLERVLAEPRLGGGHIAVTAQSRRGERLAGDPLSWLDTADGRYLVRTKSGDAGELTAEYVPAGRAELARAIRDAIAAVY